MIWEPLAAACNVAIALLVSYKLYFCFHHYNAWERLGLGLFGGSALITIPPLIYPGVPTADWAIFTFRAGLIVYLIGRILARRIFPPQLQWRRWPPRGG